MWQHGFRKNAPKKNARLHLEALEGRTLLAGAIAAPHPLAGQTVKVAVVAQQQAKPVTGDVAKATQPKLNLANDARVAIVNEALAANQGKGPQLPTDPAARPGIANGKLDELSPTDSALKQLADQKKAGLLNTSLTDLTASRSSDRSAGLWLNGVFQADIDARKAGYDAGRDRTSQQSDGEDKAGEDKVDNFKEDELCYGSAADVVGCALQAVDEAASGAGKLFGGIIGAIWSGLTAPAKVEEWTGDSKNIPNAVEGLARQGNGGLHNKEADKQLKELEKEWTPAPDKDIVPPQSAALLGQLAKALVQPETKKEITKDLVSQPIPGKGAPPPLKTLTQKEVSALGAVRVNNYINPGDQGSPGEGGGSNKPKAGVKDPPKPGEGPTQGPGQKGPSGKPGVQG